MLTTLCASTAHYQSQQLSQISKSGARESLPPEGAAATSGALSCARAGRAPAKACIGVGADREFEAACPGIGPPDRRARRGGGEGGLGFFPLVHTARVTTGSD